MQTSKLTVIFALGLAISLTGLTGCGGKKAAPTPTPQVPLSTPRPQAPQPQVQQAPQAQTQEPEVPRDLRFNTVYFDFDKSDIRQDQVSDLRRNAEMLQQYRSLRVVLEGHCDERGTDEYNLALGQRRADSVKNYLTNYGIDGSRISTVSYGESRPVAQGGSESAWSQNRRCEFTIITR